MKMKNGPKPPNIVFLGDPEDLLNFAKETSLEKTLGIATENLTQDWLDRYNDLQAEIINSLGKNIEAIMNPDADPEAVKKADEEMDALRVREEELKKELFGR